ncbi:MULTISPECIES: hypothetical protein [Mammaliicoccus]|uniref:hypothetical protein n=1 Tax=Mammaliicoccus TaxID=2803850 RepID=UPI001AADD5E3|nr:MULTISPECIES: hypothetical protein [Mammaliicoccus]MBO3063229.1 hypothetical protein [Mammaliicoccus fleurettii]MBW0763769.1 DUF4352 domain-containing protein [Mammaliicoccus fleurettii]MEB7723860.1 DUF4352 domain-containing protein [Mammaliicoccus fleurettii]MEB7778944.1 DUF4352 domain-containing protein [Mammaliicoccus fleurettii]MEB7805120.1 DUF4352 domain-containing protein [Mammaliicoccus fleurettii]
MSSILFVLLWVVISIAFIVTLAITVIKYAKEKQYSSYLASTIVLFVVGVISFVCIFVSLSFDKEYSYKQLFKEDKPKEVKHISDTPKKDLKDLKLGDKIIANGLEVTVTKAEFVLPDDGYSYSQNGKILKINYKFKNLEKDKKFIDNSNFNLTIDGEVQPQFNGMKDNKGGFQHQLEKGETKSSYLYYDVADMDKYQVNMDFKSSKKEYKANWTIAKKDIKEDLNNERTTEEVVPPQEPQTNEQQTVEQPNNSAEEQKKLDEAEKKRQKDAEDKAAKDKEAKEEAAKKAAEDKAAKEEADKKAAEQEKKQQEAAEEKAAAQKEQDQAAAQKEQAAAEQKRREQEQAAAEREKQQQQQKDQAAQQEKQRAAQEAAQKERERAAQQKQSQRDSNSSEER